MPDRSAPLARALPVPGRRADARRAAIRCGLLCATVFAYHAVQDGDPASAVALAALFWGALGALAGLASVFSGGAWRTAKGRWQVSPAFAWILAGTPVAALAGAMLGGTPPSGAGAALFGGTWVAAVLALSLALRLRARRRHGAAA